MPWVGGVFDPLYDLRADQAAGPPQSLLDADRMMELIEDLCGGIDDCLNVNGNNVPATDLNWNGQKITNAADGASVADYATVGQVIKKLDFAGTINQSTGGATVNDIIVTLANAPTSPANGYRFRGYLASANTGAMTLKFNGMSALALTDKANNALASGGVVAARYHEFMFDGTDWRIMTADEPDNSTLERVGTNVRVKDGGITLAKMANLAQDKLLGRTSSGAGIVEAIDISTIVALAVADAVPIVTAAVAFPSGTKAIFVQTSAPTGWTKDTTHNNKALRIVSGSASTGGSTAFTSVFAARTIAQNNLPNVTLIGETNSAGDHAHDLARGGGSNFGSAALRGSDVGGFSHASTTNGAHVHPFTTSSINGNVTQQAIDFAVQYVDCIIATKD